MTDNYHLQKSVEAVSVNYEDRLSRAPFFVLRNRIMKRGRPKKFPESKIAFAIRTSPIQKEIIYRSFESYKAKVDAKITLNEYILKMIFKGIDK